MPTKQYTKEQQAHSYKQWYYWYNGQHNKCTREDFLVLGLDPDRGICEQRGLYTKKENSVELPTTPDISVLF
mgnify:CR=1